MTSALPIEVRANPTPLSEEALAEVLKSPGFGTTFTDHMYTCEWTPEAGWHDARVGAYGPISLDPATAVLHYAQEIFEGLKAYRHPDGSVWAFRPDANAARLQSSARRLALPELSSADFLASIEAIVRADERWVPDAAGEKSLYLRPFMFASEAFLGVRPAKHVTYMVIASPAGAYFAQGIKPVSIMVSEGYSRAAAGGMGAAKTGGNYAASLAPQQAAIDAGFDQVVFLDAEANSYVEELGGMNLYFVYDDGSIVTPELTGTILEGITRASIIELAASLGHKVTERRITIDEWREGVSSGQIAEVFACGTAAVVTPIGRLASSAGEVDCSVDGEAGPVTLSVRDALVDLQYGRSPDSFDWLRRLC